MPMNDHPLACNCWKCNERRLWRIPSQSDPPSRPPLLLPPRRQPPHLLESHWKECIAFLLFLGLVSISIVTVWNWDSVSEHPTISSALEYVTHDHPRFNQEVAEYIVQFTNEERSSAGLNPLVHDPRISGIAKAHSDNMLSQGIQEHVLDGLDPTDRALKAGYNCQAYKSGGSYSYGLSENIASQIGGSYTTARAESTARKLVESWMGSPGHRSNILHRDARRIGVGVSSTKDEVYATQNFSECIVP